jgi:hypothetical protein
MLDRGWWQDYPAYARWSAVMSQSKLRSLACFRLDPHDLQVEAQKWEFQEADGVRVHAPVPRAERLCRLCGEGVGDELHMLADCSAYAAVRQRHAHLLSAWVVGSRWSIGSYLHLRYGNLCLRSSILWLDICVNVVSVGAYSRCGC